ncbi:hypothetical protein BY458DRAFT_536872 [Sporodiniella umbellata]|nr:hypothetical protein BY458DRAFT_536872 [Sporodiniella umbellata]
MGKRRKLPDTFEKNARTKQKTIEFAPIIKSTSNVFEKPMGTQQTQVLTMESVRIDFPLKPSWKENEKKKSKKTTREAPKDAPVDMEGTFNDWVHQFKYEETSTLTPQAYHDMQCDEQQQPQESNNDPTNYVRTRIFVGSRTHRQLSQLISELKRNTAYSPRITVLGSREQLCNHPIVSKSSNKSEDCITLLDKSECSYFHNTKKLVSNSSLKTTHRVWDIEDMVSLGKQVKGCAYYASRKLYETAEVVFCPYNYILDPVIRKLLDINLTGSIVILDEAHNMEDAARSAGSFAIDDKTLSIVKIELASIIKGGFEVEAHKLFDNLWDFITSEKNIYTIFERERSVIIWAGLEIVDKLKELGIESDMFEEYFLLAYKTVSAHADMIRKEKEKRSIDLPETEGNDSQVKIHKRECLSNNSLSVVQTIFMVFGFLFRKDRSYTNDYRMVLMSRLDPDNQSTQKKRSIVDPDWNFKLEFWCMNPGVIFQDMCASTKSVILTSGTLSPMDTFASELEISFQGKLEANHVIDPSQVWVSCIPVGPSGTNLKGVYTVVEGTPYQDDVGEALYTISTKVPFGILCFLPSYKLLNTLMARWKKTGLLERLKKIKTVFQEPKGSDKKRFEREIVRYYTTINDTQIVNGKKNGAIFFAVYRGKVSEGIDFPNNYCRAVVALGIPYPGVYVYTIVDLEFL